MSTSAVEAKSKLIERVKELAYLYSPNELFTLASGRQSPHFFDMKPVMMDPGIAIAKAGKGSTLRGFMVRKEPKGRGGRKTGNPPGIEGSTIQSGDRVVLLEDVTTTGGSALKAATRLSDMGCDVAACITILDRQEGGAEAFESAGVNLVPLLVRSDITGE